MLEFNSLAIPKRVVRLRGRGLKPRRIRKFEICMREILQHANNEAPAVPAGIRRLVAWHRRRRWARRNIRRMRQADVVVVSHTKSGRTWLRVMMSHLYHLRYGVPEQELLKFDNLHTLNAAIPRIYFTRDTENPTFSLRGGVERLSPDKKVVFMVRDPRDVAVSFYFHVLKRASAGELDRKGISSDVKSMSLYDFVVNEELGIPRIIAYMNRWHREMATFPQSILVKYEELKDNAEEVLGRVMRFIGPEFEQDELAKAVEFASFESLARKEAQGFFATGRLKPKEEADRNTYKVRRGKVGGYREDFTPEQIAAMDELVRTRLIADYGYS